MIGYYYYINASYACLSYIFAGFFILPDLQTHSLTAFFANSIVTLDFFSLLIQVSGAFYGFWLSNLLDFSVLQGSLKTHFENFSTRIFYSFMQSRFVKNLIFMFKYLTRLRLRSLNEVTAVDYPSQRLRFELNYFFTNICAHRYLHFKFSIPEGTPVTSITEVHESANWSEREVWDLFGIFFSGNKDMRRILTDYGFSGNPLRKDFPVSGFSEVLFAYSLKRVAISLTSFQQEMRNLSTSYISKFGGLVSSQPVFLERTFNFSTYMSLGIFSSMSTKDFFQYKIFSWVASVLSENSELFLWIYSHAFFFTYVSAISFFALKLEYSDEFSKKVTENTEDFIHWVFKDPDFLISPDELETRERAPFIKKDETPLEKYTRVSGTIRQRYEPYRDTPDERATYLEDVDGDPDYYLEHDGEPFSLFEEKHKNAVKPGFLREDNIETFLKARPYLGVANKEDIYIKNFPKDSSAIDGVIEEGNAVSKKTKKSLQGYKKNQYYPAVDVADDTGTPDVINPHSADELSPDIGVQNKWFESFSKEEPHLAPYENPTGLGMQSEAEVGEAGPGALPLYKLLKDSPDSKSLDDQETLEAFLYAKVLEDYEQNPELLIDDTLEELFANALYHNRENNVKLDRELSSMVKYANKTVMHEIIENLPDIEYSQFYDQEVTAGKKAEDLKKPVEDKKAKINWEVVDKRFKQEFIKHFGPAAYEKYCEATKLYSENIRKLGKSAQLHPYFLKGKAFSPDFLSSRKYYAMKAKYRLKKIERQIKLGDIVLVTDRERRKYSKELDKLRKFKRVITLKDAHSVIWLSDKRMLNELPTLFPGMVGVGLNPLAKKKRINLNKIYSAEDFKKQYNREGFFRSPVDFLMRAKPKAKPKVSGINLEKELDTYIQRVKEIQIQEKQVVRNAIKRKIRSIKYRAKALRFHAKFKAKNFFKKIYDKANIWKRVRFSKKYLTDKQRVDIRTTKLYTAVERHFLKRSIRMAGKGNIRNYRDYDWFELQRILALLGKGTNTDADAVRWNKERAEIAPEKDSNLESAESAEADENDWISDVPDEEAIIEDLWESEGDDDTPLEIFDSFWSVWTTMWMQWEMLESAFEDEDAPLEPTDDTGFVPTFLDWVEMEGINLSKVLPQELEKLKKRYADTVQAGSASNYAGEGSDKFLSIHPFDEDDLALMYDYLVSLQKMRAYSSFHKKYDNKYGFLGLMRESEYNTLQRLFIQNKWYKPWTLFFPSDNEYENKAKSAHRRVREILTFRDYVRWLNQSKGRMDNFAIKALPYDLRKLLKEKNIKPDALQVLEDIPLNFYTRGDESSRLDKIDLPFAEKDRTYRGSPDVWVHELRFLTGRSLAELEFCRLEIDQSHLDSINWILVSDANYTRRTPGLHTLSDQTAWTQIVLTLKYENFRSSNGPITKSYAALERDGQKLVGKQATFTNWTWEYYDPDLLEGVYSKDYSLEPHTDHFLNEGRAQLHRQMQTLANTKEAIGVCDDMLAGAPDYGKAVRETPVDENIMARAAEIKRDRYRLKKDLALKLDVGNNAANDKIFPHGRPIPHPDRFETFRPRRQNLDGTTHPGSAFLFKHRADMKQDIKPYVNSWIKKDEDLEEMKRAHVPALACRKTAREEAIDSYTRGDTLQRLWLWTNDIRYHNQELVGGHRNLLRKYDLEGYHNRLVTGQSLEVDTHPIELHDIWKRLYSKENNYTTLLDPTQATFGEFIVKYGSRYRYPIADFLAGHYSGEVEPNRDEITPEYVRGETSLRKRIVRLMKDYDETRKSFAYEPEREPYIPGIDKGGSNRLRELVNDPAMKQRVRKKCDDYGELRHFAENPVPVSVSKESLDKVVRVASGGLPGFTFTPQPTLLYAQYGPTASSDIKDYAYLSNRSFYRSLLHADQIEAIVTAGDHRWIRSEMEVSSMPGEYPASIGNYSAYLRDNCGANAYKDRVLNVFPEMTDIYPEYFASVDGSPLTQEKSYSKTLEYDDSNYEVPDTHVYLDPTYAWYADEDDLVATVNPNKAWYSVVGDDVTGEKFFTRTEGFPDTRGEKYEDTRALLEILGSYVNYEDHSKHSNYFMPWLIEFSLYDDAGLESTVELEDSMEDCAGTLDLDQDELLAWIEWEGYELDNETTESMDEKIKAIANRLLLDNDNAGADNFIEATENIGTWDNITGIPAYYIKLLNGLTGWPDTFDNSWGYFQVREDGKKPLPHEEHLPWWEIPSIGMPGSYKDMRAFRHSKAWKGKPWRWATEVRTGPMVRTGYARVMVQSKEDSNKFAWVFVHVVDYRENTELGEPGCLEILVTKDSAAQFFFEFPNKDTFSMSFILNTPMRFEERVHDNFPTLIVPGGYTMRFDYLPENKTDFKSMWWSTELPSVTSRCFKFTITKNYRDINEAYDTIPKGTYIWSEHKMGMRTVSLRTHFNRAKELLNSGYSITSRVWNKVRPWKKKPSHDYIEKETLDPANEDGEDSQGEN